jgi:hypothetical protein
MAVTLAVVKTRSASCASYIRAAQSKATEVVASSSRSCRLGHVDRSSSGSQMRAGASDPFSPSARPDKSLPSGPWHRAAARLAGSTRPFSTHVSPISPTRLAGSGRLFSGKTSQGGLAWETRGFSLSGSQTLAAGKLSSVWSHWPGVGIIHGRPAGGAYPQLALALGYQKGDGDMNVYTRAMRKADALKHIHAWLQEPDMRNCVGERYTAYDTSPAPPLPRRSGYPIARSGRRFP